MAMENVGGKKIEKEDEKKVAKILSKPKVEFLPGVIGIKMTGEDKGQYLEVNLEEYFERLNRQGWAGIKIKKL